MTDAERAFLKTQIDHVVVLETVRGERLLAQILFVFDEGETPDLFFLEVEPAPDGSYVKKENAGHSILLSDIITVQPPPSATRA
ncbi:hypothetical protein [Edaphobacter bradus]|uniref:hypothetical protein n=1 Tax=Edaphobacter bradus TaxID=2259016 RepID=UPI0021DFF0E4|nr:hypothetical protein [Edaphobacter bradus]